MGVEIEHGVNENGVQWLKEDSTYYCVYYYGEGVEIRCELSNVSRSVIDKLTPQQMKERK